MLTSVLDCAWVGKMRAEVRAQTCDLRRQYECRGDHWSRETSADDHWSRETSADELVRPRSPSLDGAILGQAELRVVQPGSLMSR